MERKLKLIKRPLKKWNREVFGHIDINITKFDLALRKAEEEALRREIGEVEWSRIEALRTQMWLWMVRKERYWKQLSRCKVIREGDRNTKYFHLSATMRRNRNRIDNLLIQGVEVSDEGRIKSSILEYFKDLYSKQQSTSFDIAYLLSLIHI